MASRLVKPLAAALGAPGERFGGVSGQLARENATRNPTRTARTAGRADDRPGAGHARGHTRREPQGHQPWRARGPGQGGLRRDLRQRLRPVHDRRRQGARRTRPAWRVASSVRSDSAVAFGDEGKVTGVDPATIGQVYDYRWNKGSDSVLLSLGFDGAVVRDAFADAHNLAVGDDFAITTPPGQEGAARGARDLQAAIRGARPAAGRGDARAAGVRHALPAAKGPVLVRRHGRGRHEPDHRGARARARPVPRTRCCAPRRTGWTSVPVGST